MPACVSNGAVVLDVYRSRKPITTFNPFGALRIDVSSSGRMNTKKKSSFQKKIAQKTSSLKKKAMKKAMNPTIDIVFSENDDDLMPTKMSLSDLERYYALPKGWIYDDGKNYRTYCEIDDIYDSVVRFCEVCYDETEGVIDWLCDSEKIDLGDYEDPYVLQSVMKKVPLKGMYYLHEFDTLF